MCFFTFQFIFCKIQKLKGIWSLVQWSKKHNTVLTVLLQKAVIICLFFLFHLKVWTDSSDLSSSCGQLMSTGSCPLFLLYKPLIIPHLPQPRQFTKDGDRNLGSFACDTTQEYLESPFLLSFCDFNYTPKPWILACPLLNMKINISFYCSKATHV